ncbi:hypothetical protein EB061_12695 [bacterium]|nr:hypothetical protein [bacterium]
METDTEGRTRPTAAMKKSLLFKECRASAGAGWSFAPTPALTGVMEVCIKNTAATALHKYLPVLFFMIPPCDSFP